MSGPVFVSVPVPADRVQDVYRLLAGVDGTFTLGDPEPAFGTRKAPRCRVETVRGGVVLRCLKGPRHQGRHRYVPLQREQVAGDE